MKKTFSALLIAVFSAYALFLHQSASGAHQPSPAVAGLSSAPSAGVSVPSAAPAPAPAPPAAPSSQDSSPVTLAPPPKQLGAYTDGTFLGDSVYAYYGYVQVAAVIQSGRLADVQIYEYPRDQRTSAEINSQALPMLISEAVSAQSADIRSISGASDTSPAFKQSLASALAKAKA